MRSAGGSRRKASTCLMTHHHDPIAATPRIRRLVAGAEWQPVTIGMSGAEVWRILTPGKSPRYLKSATGPRIAELRAERDRLAWLQGRLPVPAIHAWLEEGARNDEADSARAWLLLAEAPGRMACDPTAAGDPERVVHLLAAGLRQIHGLPIRDCPFDTRLDWRLEFTERNIRLGLVDETAVRDTRGIDADALLDQLRATRPDEPPADLVFTHGDYCLPNILLDDAFTHVTAWLDWGRAGVSDRYLDLAIGARSVRYNLGAEWGPRFLAAYGLDQLDQKRLDWYETLDELF